MQTAVNETTERLTTDFEKSKALLETKFQGDTVQEAKQSLKEAVDLILEDRLSDAKRGLPDDAIQETIAIV